ncbi:MAG: hypothetical protein M3R52_00965 [Acidobacteriota bacterium]|nr:hypothetical protein [Acidobacteriota bacterium]
MRTGLRDSFGRNLIAALPPHSAESRRLSVARARTIYMTLWEVANRPTRPKVDKQLPAQFM